MLIDSDLSRSSDSNFESKEQTKEFFDISEQVQKMNELREKIN